MSVQQVLRLAGITDAEHDELMAFGGDHCPQLRRQLMGSPDPEVMNLVVRIAAKGIEYYPEGEPRRVLHSSICDKIHHFRAAQAERTRTGYGDRS